MPDHTPHFDSRAARTGFASRIALVAFGLLAAAALLFVVLKIDLGESAATRPDRPDEVIELIPEPLGKEAPSVGRFDPKADATMPALSEGGFIQNFDQEGNLAQQYRFQSLDPNPPGMPASWVQMEEPEAEIYLGDGRALHLRGNQALAHVPHRVLESATLTGDVTIRLVEPPPGQAIDLERDEPLLEVHADMASFDNVIGEVRCPGEFTVASRSLEFPGRGFTMLVNDQGQRVALRVEVEHVEFVRLARGPQAESTPPAAVEPKPRARPDQPPKPPTAKPAPTPVDPEPEQPQFYRLTLRDTVKISEGPATARRTATGDALTLIFSSQSEALTPTLVFAGVRPFGIDSLTTPSVCHALTAQRQSMSLIGRLSLALFALPTPSIAPPPRDDDIIITCAGGMTIVPIAGPADILDSPKDARLTLSGHPVRLHDPAQDARAECDRLVYQARNQKIELLGSESQPLSMSAPKFAAGGELFWIRRGEGGFTGPGWIETLEDPGDEGPAPADAPGPAQMQVRWTDGLDLDFEQPADDGAMGRLRRATFRGEVTTADAERTMWADELGVAFSLGGEGQEVESIEATGDIQILLTNGARVFADRLAGDAAAETIVLTGENITLAHDLWLIDEGRHIALDQVTESADWQGPGLGRRFATPLDLGAQRRLRRPTIDTEPEAQVRWNGSMRYDQSAGDGAGAIELHGGVEAVSEPNPLERSTFRARDVTLALADDGGEGGQDSRRLGRVIALGDARMERRDWTQPDRSDEPRIFFLRGERIEYDDRTGEGIVPGAGELLMRDLRDADDADAAESAVAFGAKGTTSFRWREKLLITRRQGTIYDVAMVDGIEMRHLSPDGQTATMTCDRVGATIDRAEAESVDAAPVTDPISGPAELVHLRAEGGVFLHTTERDVECHVFDYDVRAGVAELIAPPGGFVNVMTLGTPHPVRMERATWDLKQDEVTIVRGVGAGPR